MGDKLKILKTEFEGLCVIETDTFHDARGSFSRFYCTKELEEISNISIEQINHSVTDKKGTTRGLHFQYEPNSEVKIIRCIKGSVFDVLVDIRKDSDTFLKVFTYTLSQENEKMLYIPKGFAHGFQALEDNSELLYLHSSVYEASNEGALNIKDSLLDIKWPLDIVNVSKRDSSHPFIESSFKGVELDEM